MSFRVPHPGDLAAADDNVEIHRGSGPRVVEVEPRGADQGPVEAILLEHLEELEYLSWKIRGRKISTVSKEMAALEDV